MRATEGVGLHTGPSVNYEQLGRLIPDETVTVTQEVPGWAWVETESGKQGFVPISALMEVEEPAVAEVEEPASAAVVTEPKCRYLIDVFADQFTDKEIRDPESLDWREGDSYRDRLSQLIHVHCAALMKGVSLGT